MAECELRGQDGEAGEGVDGPRTVPMEATEPVERFAQKGA